LATTIRRLEEHDSVDGFDCGDVPLNSYLQQHAWNNQRKTSIGITYVAVEEAAPQTVMGYFTLATASVPRNAMPRKAVRGLPAYDLPMLLLAGLAVDRRFKNRGLGHSLLAEALKIAAAVSEQAGCRCVIVDAYPSAIAWYQRYGFQPIEGSKGSGLRMYLDIRTVRAAQQQKLTDEQTQ